MMVLHRWASILGLVCLLFLGFFSLQQTSAEQISWSFETSDQTGGTDGRHSVVPDTEPPALLPNAPATDSLAPLPIVVEAVGADAGQPVDGDLLFEDVKDAGFSSVSGLENLSADVIHMNSPEPEYVALDKSERVETAVIAGSLDTEDLDVAMRSFGSAARLNRRQLQPQIKTVNGEKPDIILQQTNLAFDKVIVDTLAVQDAVFEAEKGILSRRQDKKVVEGDYIPQANAEVFGQYHIWDNYRDFDPLDEYDLSLSTDWKVYDFGRKRMKYESADLSIEISYNQLKTIHNNEVARLLKIYTDYSHQTEKMRLVEGYEGLLISLREEVEGRISGGVGTILEKNQFDQTLNALRLRKLDASKLLQSAKTDYQLYFSDVFDETILPTLDEFQVRAEAVLGGIFELGEQSPLEEKLKLEIKKAVLEKEISASEYYPDIRVGLEVKKYDLYDNDNEFEILGTLTSKMTLFDGFKRQYSVRSKGEEIAGLAAKLRLTKIQKEQRIKRYEIEYENLQNEITSEIIKIEKIQNDFDIAKDMTDLKALTFGERISFASDILTSQLRLLENYYQQYEILIDVLDLKGGFSDMFEIEPASEKRTL